MIVKYTLIYAYDPAEARPGGEEEVDEWLAFDQAVRESGEFVHEAGFDDSSPAKIVTIREGEPKITDEPASGTRAAGFYVVDVPDQQAAIALAQRLPTSRYGRVEIRKVAEV